MSSRRSHMPSPLHTRIATTSLSQPMARTSSSLSRTLSSPHSSCTIILPISLRLVHPSNAPSSPCKPQLPPSFRLSSSRHPLSHSSSLPLFPSPFSPNFLKFAKTTALRVPVSSLPSLSSHKSVVASPVSSPPPRKSATLSLPPASLSPSFSTLSSAFNYGYTGAKTREKR